MIVQAIIKFKFDFELTTDDVVDILKTGEYYPWNVIDCGVISSTT